MRPFHRCLPLTVGRQRRHQTVRLQLLLRQPDNRNGGQQKVVSMLAGTALPRHARHAGSSHLPRGRHGRRRSAVQHGATVRLTWPAASRPRRRLATGQQAATGSTEDTWSWPLVRAAPQAEPAQAPAAADASADLPRHLMQCTPAPCGFCAPAGAPPPPTLPCVLATAPVHGVRQAMGSRSAVLLICLETFETRPPAQKHGRSSQFTMETNMTVQNMRSLPRQTGRPSELQPLQAISGAQYNVQ